MGWTEGGDSIVKMLLHRDVKAPTFTLGKLAIENREFDTCEDTVREIPNVPVEQWKIKSQTAIPAGKYKVIINFSNRFQKHLPLLLDVPGFEGIRIHSLNNAGQSEGCIGVGLTRSSEIGWIYESRKAMNIIQPMIQSALDNGEEVWIEIT